MEQITYEWIRSRRKTIAIQIKEGGKVVVRTPYSISRKQVEDFLREKQDWIVKNQKQLHKVQENRMVITQDGGVAAAKVILTSTGSLCLCRWIFWIMWSYMNWHTEER